MALLESCSSLSKSFGSRTLFENISLGISEGERLGLIGRNGSGKSTLLKILCGQLQSDSGEISMRRNARVGYVPQETVFAEGRTAAETVAEAIAGERLDELERAARINVALGRAGFADGAARVESLSGGWTFFFSMSPPTTWISKASCGSKGCSPRPPSPAW
jgi:ATP-binding cassette subfamily F protein uup